MVVVISVTVALSLRLWKKKNGAAFLRRLFPKAILIMAQRFLAPLARH
jgi:hypothetical protein